MIPLFPRFLALSAANADEYRSYVQSFPPYADFNLINRLSWDLDGSAAVSLLNGNLILRLPNYRRHTTRTTILGTDRLEHTITSLLTYMEAQSVSPQLELVPEHVIDHLPSKDLWQTSEDLDNSDHVLSMLRLANMQGPKLRHYRRSVHAFLRQYEPRHSFHTLDVSCPLTQETMLRIFLKREGSKHNNHYKPELLALTKLFDLAKQADTQSFGISINGMLRGFIICERMNDSWMIGHFWKADTAFEGIYSYLMHRTATRLLKQGYEYFNVQQDLGITGLRSFKESLAPVLYLRKYTLAKVS